ncbi:MAG: DUF4255 domain-containing protein [Litoreibacter sp.]|nr:DUF4255 domain-containing protein [Litoreibacter sp.]
MTDIEGKQAPEARNRLVMFLVNVAQDAVPRGPSGAVPTGLVQSQPLHLDIYFMLASAHDADLYEEGLKLLSAGITFFQSFPVFSLKNTPEMPVGVTQLSFELSNLKSEELGQLWGNLGGRYVPSVMYKMRSVVVDGAVIRDVEPLVRAPGTDLRPEGSA